MPADQDAARITACLSKIDGNDRVDWFAAGCVIFTHPNPALS
jgi:hypothetical protein